MNQPTTTTADRKAREFFFNICCFFFAIQEHTCSTHFVVAVFFLVSGSLYFLCKTLDLVNAKQSKKTEFNVCVFQKQIPTLSIDLIRIFFREIFKKKICYHRLSTTTTITTTNKQHTTHTHTSLCLFDPIIHWIELNILWWRIFFPIL